MAASNLTDPLESDRVSHAMFSQNHSDPEYRSFLAQLHHKWEEYNKAHFNGQLRTPHLCIGPTSARRFSHCRSRTTNGGMLEITLSEAIVFATNTRVVRRPWPAEGLTRFFNDLLLGEEVKQYVLEVRGATEEGYGGYGPLYAAEATRIGEPMGLGAVLARRRGHRGEGLPVAASWPWAFRPENYYLGDVRLDRRAVAGLRPRPTHRLAALPGAYEYFLYLIVTGKSDRLRDILERQVDMERETRSPALAAAERGPIGVQLLTMSSPGPNGPTLIKDLVPLMILKIMGSSYAPVCFACLSNYFGEKLRILPVFSTFLFEGAATHPESM